MGNREKNTGRKERQRDRGESESEKEKKGAWGKKERNNYGDRELSRETCEGEVNGNRERMREKERGRGG